MTKTPDISIIIVSWNVREFLKICLDSIYKFSGDVDFEIFVVDNNSSDASADMVRIRFPGVNLIENRENLGFAKANNLALARCAGRYILFLNPDTELIDNAPKSMVEFMDAHRAVDAIGCKLLCSDGSLQMSCRLFPSLSIDLIENLYLDSLFPKSGFLNRYRMIDWPHDDFRRIDQPYGACLAVKKEILEKIGFMDERFFMYYDETDLCYRIRKSGGSVYYTPGIKLIHHGNKSSNQVGPEIDRWKIRSRLLFFQKRYGRISFWPLIFNLSLRSLIVLFIFPLTNLVFGRPRDVGYFKDSLKVSWGEYVSFFKSAGIK